MGEISGFPVRPGMFDVNGALPLPCGVNFTIHTHGGTSCELLLFHRGEEEPYAVLPFPESYKIGDVYSMIVYGLNIREFEYAYRVDGPYDPARGLLFNKNTILLDPYARAVTGQNIWGVKKPQHYHARVVKDVFDWGDTKQSTREMSELVIYELHVRGFTRHPSSGVEHKGTYAGLKEKIPYLKELGINAVELMPIFEFDERMDVREVNGKRLLEYWGYNTVSFFAPVRQAMQPPLNSTARVLNFVNSLKRFTTTISKSFWMSCLITRQKEMKRVRASVSKALTTISITC